jgi:hypothetical protein
MENNGIENWSAHLVINESVPVGNRIKYSEYDNKFSCFPTCKLLK